MHAILQKGLHEKNTIFFLMGFGVLGFCLRCGVFYFAEDSGVSPNDHE